MANGGFAVKFEGAKEKPQKCYAIKLDYDEWSYTINNEPAKELPQGVKRIVIEIK